MKIADALRALEAREARLLLARASGFSEASVLAHPERELPADVEAAFRAFAARRARGEPVAYILGEKEFYGLPLAVTPAALIPRPETELLVELALGEPFDSALDLGTGTGAIALALKRQRPEARVVAVERSAAALALAQRNAQKLGLDVEFRHGLWFGPVAGERFDLVVSNPPYVREGDPHLEEGDVRFEPRAALVAGQDGLDAVREIVRDAPGHLNPGGRILLEHGLGQDGAVRSLLVEAGIEGVATWPDLAGIARVSGGRLKS
ncbi:MAG: peptide chain release factor N(5)-glutamine methyltransferase [Betaproteobacteria bacterium]|nr:peptide chain release factor N(5)-glutamine methyltransferase [Betaproteobacteria bacterium]